MAQNIQFVYFLKKIYTPYVEQSEQSKRLYHSRNTHVKHGIAGTDQRYLDRRTLRSHKAHKKKNTLPDVRKKSETAPQAPKNIPNTVQIYYSA